MAVNIAVQVPLIIYSDFAYDLSTFMTKPNSYSPFRIAKSLRWLKLSDLWLWFVRHLTSVPIMTPWPEDDVAESAMSDARTSSSQQLRRSARSLIRHKSGVMFDRMWSCSFIRCRFRYGCSLGGGIWPIDLSERGLVPCTDVRESWNGMIWIDVVYSLRVLPIKNKFYWNWSSWLWLAQLDPGWWF